MHQKYYFDTSIWIDLYHKRGNNGELAKQLVRKIILEEGIIVYSDFTIIELKRLKFSKKEIDNILGIARNNLERVHVYEEQIKEARRLARERDVPHKDALYAVLARDNQLQLISNDDHFNKLKDITKTKKPEGLI